MIRLVTFCAAAALAFALAGPVRAVGLHGFDGEELFLPSSPPAPRATAVDLVGPFKKQEKSPVKPLFPKGLAPGAPLGGFLAQVDLNGKLDAVRRTSPVQVGGKSWSLSFAADSSFRYFYAVLTDAQGTVFRPLTEPKQFLDKGVSIDLPGSCSYLCKVAISLPIHRSRIELLSGDGSLAAFVEFGLWVASLEKQLDGFDLDGSRYYAAYVTDMDPVTGKPAATRSLVFLHEAIGLPKAWAMPESALPVGQPISVSLGKHSLVLVRMADGTLDLYSPPSDR